MVMVMVIQVLHPANSEEAQGPRARRQLPPRTAVPLSVRGAGHPRFLCVSSSELALTRADANDDGL